MAKQLINLGNENAGNGDPLRVAFSKINGNFDEVYSLVEGFDLTNSIPILTGNTGKFLSNDGTSLTWENVPSANQLTNNDHTVSVDSDGRITVDGDVYYISPVITIDHIPPSDPISGNLWYDTESGRTYVYYDTSWVDANPKGPSGTTIPNQNGNAGKVLTTDGSNLSWITASGGGAVDLGKFVINGGNILATVNDEVPGAFGSYNINIDPGGESSAGISIPSVPNQVSGGTLQIFNTSSSGGQIMMNTYGGMTIASVRGTLGLGLDLETPGVPDHFHVAFETSNSFIPTKDLFFGDDYNYLRLVNAAQGVFIGTNNRTGGDQHQWRFQTDGKFKLPAGGDIVDSNGNSVLGGGGGSSIGDFIFDGSGMSTPEDSNLVISTTTADNDYNVITIAQKTFDLTVQNLTSNNFITLTFENSLANDPYALLVVGTNTVNQNWKFNKDGDLILPDNGTIRDTANNDLLAGGSSTGQWSFNGDTAYNATGNGLYIQTNQGSGDGSIYLPYQDEGSNINIRNDSGGGIELSINGTTTWTFDTDGRTKFPVAALPEHSYGAAGDKQGMMAFDADYIYYCTQDYVDDLTNIWKRVSWGPSTW